MDNDEATIRLGNEYDSQLREGLLAILKEMGAVVRERTYGIGGSQELEELTVTVENKVLVVEAETYIGLVVKGERRLVEEIGRRVHARLKPLSPLK